MNSVATVLMQLGVAVSGSDRQDSKYLQALAARGARVHVGHRAEQVGDADTLVTTQAIRDTNPEVVEARARGIRILHRSAVSAALLRRRRGVAVAGTHGKTTTTAMISQVLAAAGRDPSYLIGGALTGTDTGGHLGSGDVLVVEADESDGTFLQYPAEIAVVTNVDPDHLVNWGTPENYAEGFLRFATASDVRAAGDQCRRARRGGPDRNGSATMTQPPAIITFGETAGADIHIAEVSVSGMGSRFRLQTCGREVGTVALSVPGSLQRLERGGELRRGPLVRSRRRDHPRGADRLRRHLPAVPAGRHRPRDPRLRRLRAPPDRGRQHAPGGADRRRATAGSWSVSSRISTPVPETSGASWPPPSSPPTRRS